MNINNLLLNAEPGWGWIKPSPFKAFKFRWIKPLLTGIRIQKVVIRIIRKDDIEDIISDYLSKELLIKLFKIPSKVITKRWHFKKDRTWLNPLDIPSNKRMNYPVVVIFHDANRAGRHLDIHLGRWSIIARITGKPVESQLKYNSKGYLTEDSKKALLDHLNSEITNNSRFAQNLDHTISNARMSWPLNPALKEVEGYGSGVTRQIVAESRIEYYHPDLTTSLHMYCPIFGSHQGTYMYQIQKDTPVPIVIWGKLIPRDRNFEDRLHLKMIDVNEFNKFKDKVDLRTNTIKIDGASCYFNSSKLGAKLWSPRISKETGHRIEYTWKCPELAMLLRNNHNAEGMGELIFKKTFLGVPYKTLSAAEIGGVLNSNNTRPKNIIPVLNLYRIDRYDGMNTNSIPFFENRELQMILKNECKIPWLKVVKLSPAWKTLRTIGIEGFVGVPKGLSVNEGFKIKFLADAIDMNIKNINLGLSDKGNVNGTITATFEGKDYFFGASQLGGFDQSMDIMDNPNKYIGSTIKVVGRVGGVSRAAKVIGFHLDK